MKYATLMMFRNVVIESSRIASVIPITIWTTVPTAEKKSVLKNAVRRTGSATNRA